MPYVLSGFVNKNANSVTRRRRFNRGSIDQAIEAGCTQAERTGEKVFLVPSAIGIRIETKPPTMGKFYRIDYWPETPHGPMFHVGKFDRWQCCENFPHPFSACT